MMAVFACIQLVGWEEIPKILRCIIFFQHSSRPEHSLSLRRIPMAHVTAPNSEEIRPWFLRDVRACQNALLRIWASLEPYPRAMEPMTPIRNMAGTRQLL